MAGTTSGTRSTLIRTTFGGRHDESIVRHANQTRHDFFSFPSHRPWSLHDEIPDPRRPGRRLRPHVRHALARRAGRRHRRVDRRPRGKRRCRQLSHRRRERREDLLSRGRPEERPHRAAAPRLPDLVADVPQPDAAVGRPLPRDRAGLPRFRPERHAGAGSLQLYLRQSRQGDRRVHRNPRPDALRAVRAGLRRAGRLSDRRGASQAHHRDRRAERQRLRGGHRRRFLEAAEGLLGRSFGGQCRAPAPTAAVEGDALALRGRDARARPPGPRHLDARPGLSRSPRQPGDPAGPVLQLRQQRGAIRAMAGLFPRVPAADADRLGQERQGLPAGRRAPICATCPRRSCTCSTPAISRWRRMAPRSAG